MFGARMSSLTGFDGLVWGWPWACNSRVWSNLSIVSWPCSSISRSSSRFVAREILMWV